MQMQKTPFTSFGHSKYTSLMPDEKTMSTPHIQDMQTLSVLGLFLGIFLILIGLYKISQSHKNQNTTELDNEDDFIGIVCFDIGNILFLSGFFLLS